MNMFNPKNKRIIVGIIAGILIVSMVLPVLASMLM